MRASAEVVKGDASSRENPTWIALPEWAEYSSSLIVFPLDREPLARREDARSDRGRMRGEAFGEPPRRHVRVGAPPDARAGERAPVDRDRHPRRQQRGGLRGALG